MISKVIKKDLIDLVVERKNTKEISEFFKVHNSTVSRNIKKYRLIRK